AAEARVGDVKSVSKPPRGVPGSAAESYDRAVQRAIAACLALVLLAAAVPAGESTPRARLAPPIRDGQHVRAVGRSLVVGGRELRFLGANVAVMHGPRQRAAAEATLDAVAADGLSVVR